MAFPNPRPGGSNNNQTQEAINSNEGYQRLYYRVAEGNGIMLFDEKKLANGDLIIKVLSKEPRWPRQPRLEGETPPGRKYAMRCRRVFESPNEDNETYVCKPITPEQGQPSNDRSFNAQMDLEIDRTAPPARRRLNFSANDRTFTINNTPGQRSASQSPEEFIPFDNIESLPQHIRDAYEQLINDDDQ